MQKKFKEYYKGSFKQLSKSGFFNAKVYLKLIVFFECQYIFLGNTSIQNTGKIFRGRP